MTIIERINGWHPVILSAGAIGFSFSNVELGLRITVLIVALGYSIWKWRHEYLKSKKK